MRVWDPLRVSSGICGPRHVTTRTGASAESDGRARGAAYRHSVGTAAGGFAAAPWPGPGRAFAHPTAPSAEALPAMLGGPEPSLLGPGRCQSRDFSGISAVPRCPRHALVPHREVCTAECDVPSDPGSVQEPPWLTNVSGCVCGSETARASGECERAEGTVPGWPKALPGAGPQEGLRAHQGCPHGVTRHRPLHGLRASTLLHFTPQGPQEG